MALRLSQFDYTVKHCPSKTNVADYYSRHPCSASTSAFLEEIKTEQYINMIVDNVVPGSIILEEMAQAAKQDPGLCKLIERVSKAADVSKLPERLSACKRVYDELSELPPLQYQRENCRN